MAIFHETLIGENMRSKNVSKKWTEAEEKKLFTLKSQGTSYNEISDALGRTAESCRKKYNSTKWNDREFYTDALEKANTSLLKEKNDDNMDMYVEHLLNLEANKESKYNYRAQLIAKALEKSIKALPECKKEVYKKPKGKVKRSCEEAAIIISDIHIGHEFTLEETGGIAEYNEDIIAKRTKNLTYAVADIIDMHNNKLCSIPRLNIFCLGDIVAGMNNVGQWSNTFINMTVYDQMIKGCEQLSEMIYYWLPMFEEIHFYGIRGNHGRCSEKGGEKDYVNWDIICYEYLKQRFASNDKIKFTLPKAWWLCEERQGYKFLLVHGDDIRGGKYPITNLENFEDKMSGILDDNIDYTLAGHFHNVAELGTNRGRLIVNGAFMGGDVYSIKELHKATIPAQKLFGIHPKHGVTWTYNINLATERQRNS